MRLDRYTGETVGKFSIIEIQKGGRVVNIGDPEDDFFVLKLKDKHAAETLHKYADQAEADGDQELADDVRRLAVAAARHPHQKRPD